MPDPRGGVRHVIPDKGNYLTEEALSLDTCALAEEFVGIYGRQVQPWVSGAPNGRLARRPCPGN